MRPEAARVAAREHKTGFKIAAELTLEVGHRIQLRIRKVIRSISQTRECLEGLPAQIRGRTRFHVLGIQGGGNTVGHGVSSKQHQLRRYCSSIWQPRVKKPAEVT